MSPCVAGGVVNTPTPCSCWMCGNPRRRDNTWGGNPLTMQEQKAFSAYKDQVEEYHNWMNYYYDYDYPGNVSYDDFYDDYGTYGEDPADDWYLRWMYVNE